MSSQAQKVRAEEDAEARSLYAEITALMEKRAEDGIVTLPVSSCRKVLTWVEWRQQDLAMASLPSEYDPQDVLMDKGRFKAFEEVADKMKYLIEQSERELQDKEAEA